MSLRELFGVELPIIQAPMAGAQGSAMTIAVSEAGGLGSLPCAMLSPQTMRDEMRAIRAKTTRPYNVNFFCHVIPNPAAERGARWRGAPPPYSVELGLAPSDVPAGAPRAPFSDEAADVLEELRPPVVSFHF